MVEAAVAVVEHRRVVAQDVRIGVLIAIICRSIDGDVRWLDDSDILHAPQPQRADHEISVSGPNAKTPIPHPEPARVGIGCEGAAIVADRVKRCLARPSASACRP